jgi:hypothetical protein
MSAIDETDMNVYFRIDILQNVYLYYFWNSPICY